MRKIAIIFFALAMMAGARAQSISLSLDSCLALAVRNNKDLTIAQMKEDVATLNRKEAFTHYLPRVDATGAYVRTEKQLSLLSDEQKDALSNMGTTMGEKAGPIIQNMATRQRWN